MILPSLISIYAFSIFPLVSSTVMLYSVLVSSVSSLPSPSVSLPGLVSEISVFPSLSVIPSLVGGTMTLPSLSVTPTAILASTLFSVSVSDVSGIFSFTVTEIFFTPLPSLSSTVTVILLLCSIFRFSGSNIEIVPSSLSVTNAFSIFDFVSSTITV